MRVAVILSGTIRKPEHSLASLQKFVGCEVDTYIYAWKNVARTQEDSWSKAPSLEPEERLIQLFQPTAYQLEDWEDHRPGIVGLVEKWQARRKFTFTNYGMVGMYASLSGAADLCPDWTDYDLVVRMRFDCLLQDDPLRLSREPGWMVPSGRDYATFGINDQLGFLWIDYNNPLLSLTDGFGYFGVYNRLGEMLGDGVPFHPETLLAANMSHYRARVRREEYKYIIHQNQG